MGTEKSLLTYETVMSKLDSLRPLIDKESLVLPVGVNQNSIVDTVTLTNENNLQNAVFLGQLGSGKSVYVTYLICALRRLYPEDLIIYYVDGKDCEIRQWLDNNGEVILSGPNHFESASYHGALVELLYYVAHCVRLSKERSVIILDDISHLLSESKEVSDAVIWLFNWVNLYNSHVVYVSQREFLPAIKNTLAKQACVGITRASAEVVKFYHNTDMATETRKYGDIVIKDSNGERLLVVPFTSSHDVKNKCWLA